MRTRLNICARKARFASARDALLIAERSDVPLRPYRCDRCRHFHLTSRTKGKRVPRPGAVTVAAQPANAPRATDHRRSSLTAV